MAAVEDSMVKATEREVIDQSLIEISTNVEGKFTTLYVKEGEMVSNGQLMAFMEATDQSVSLKMKRIRSPSFGRVRKILRQIGEKLPAQTPLIQLALEECRHTTVIRDMCATCGKDLFKLNVSNTKTEMFTMVPNAPDLVVSQDLADELAKSDIDRLLNSRKLVLIVDLDLTLIHTRMLSPEINLNGLTQEKQIYHTCQLIHGYNVFHQYLTKLRPYVEEFLQEASTMFELHVVTMGSRSYARDIVRILDPTTGLFYNRILTRDEMKSQLVKSNNLDQLFPLGDNLVCIIDDRPELWEFHPSCLPVPPYAYFANVGDINDPKQFMKGQKRKSSKSKQTPKKDVESQVTQGDDTSADQQVICSQTLECHNDCIKQNGESVQLKEVDKQSNDKECEDSQKDALADDISKEDNNNNNNDAVDSHTRDCEHVVIKQKATMWKTAVDPETNIVYYDTEDTYLRKLIKLLRQIHTRFYQQYDQLRVSRSLPDLKVIVPEIRKSILKDVRIAFSSVIPNGHPHPESTYEWSLALSLGAKVSHKVRNRTTHVITKRSALRDGYTEKVHLATRTVGTLVVDIDWLYKCNEEWVRVEEEPFLLTPVCTSPSGRMQLLTEYKRRRSSESSGRKRKHSLIDGSIEGQLSDKSSSDSLTSLSRSSSRSSRSSLGSNSSSSSSVASKSNESSPTNSSADSEWEAMGAMLEAQLDEANKS